MRKAKAHGTESRVSTLILGFSRVQLMEEERSSGDSPSPTTVITGTIDLRSRDPAAADLTDRVHLLPCSIKHDGPSAVSHYFKPRKTDVAVDGLSVEEAFFRGRKLQGTTVPLPEGYRGYVLGKKKAGKGKGQSIPEGDFSHWVSCAEFRNLTYWNHDSVPSQDDPLLRCFHWFSVADALHKPVTAEELASASIQDRKG